MTLKELREIVCTKRVLPVEQYAFQILDSNVVINPDNTTLGELNEREGLRLVESKKQGRGNSATASLQRKGSTRNIPARVEAGDAPRQVSFLLEIVLLVVMVMIQISKVLGPIFFLTPATASQYKSYNVMKYNKFGAKQDRIIGIDSERIVTVHTGSQKTNANTVSY
jgi:hypothetical protein